MPFKVSTVDDERRDFVIQARQPDANMSALCRRFGISRRTGYKWLGRYREADSLAGVQELSRRPHHSPRALTGEVVERLVALRRRYGWGARKLLHLLSQAGISSLPSESTANRIFKRRRLVEATDRHRPALHRFQRERCNELWQMDFKGEYHLGAGWCYPLSILDDCSRFVVGLYALADQRTASVQQSLIRTFEHHGVPEAMLMDHGQPWWSTTNHHGLTRLGVSLINQGIRLLFGRVGHPQTQGKVERFHRTLNHQIRRSVLPTSLSGFQSRFDCIRQEYNQIRPHEALAMTTPAEHYRPSSRMYQPTPPPWDYPSDTTVVKLNPQGCFDYRRHRYFVSEALAGQYVQLEHIDDKLAIRYRHMYVREIDQRTGRSVSLLRPDDGPNVYTMS